MHIGAGLLAYLLGSFPTGVVISKKRYGLDVREMGSGNIGATNVTRVFGWYAGIFTLLIDFLKGYVPLLLVQRFYPEYPWLIGVVSISLVLGHCYSIYLKFKGGKGVATGAGCLLAVAPEITILCVIVYGLLLWLTKISAVGSLGAMFVAIIAVLATDSQPSIVVLTCILALIISLRHSSNIRRLIDDFRKRHKESK